MIKEPENMTIPAGEDHLPEQASRDDVMHAVYVRQNLECSLQAAREGQITSHEDAKKFLNCAD